MATTSEPQLTVIMPVYNESVIIGVVIKDWTSTLDALGIPYVFRLYNDGLKDNTRDVLDGLKGGFPHLEVIHKPNGGHGPTILQGYREARTEWVFQADSDDEMKASHFAGLWQQRDRYDFLLGSRQARGGPLPRGAHHHVRRKDDGECPVRNGDQEYEFALPVDASAGACRCV